MRLYKIFILVFSVVVSASIFAQKESIPKGFVNVAAYIPDLDIDLKYYSIHNFVGDTITGYESNTLYLTKQATQQLKRVHDELQKQNLCLRIFDGYRPQRAVNHFIVWAKDLNDTLNKSIFYPDVEKRNLFKEEYIASRSGHSRGSTVDLTILDGETGEPLDMGTPFDYFGKESWVKYPNLTEEQKANRLKLKAIMNKYNFRGYSKEWWHFTLRGEPFPKTYFDFVIK